MAVTRLQGQAFHFKKPFLTALSYSESTNGRIRVEYKDKFGKRYCHWLNPDEIVSFDKSTLPLTKWRKKAKA